MSSWASADLTNNEVWIQWAFDKNNDGSVDSEEAQILEGIYASRRSVSADSNFPECIEVYGSMTDDFSESELIASVCLENPNINGFAQWQSLQHRPFNLKPFAKRRYPYLRVYIESMHVNDSNYDRARVKEFKFATKNVN